MSDQVIYGPTLEGLFVRGLGDKLTPELVAGLQALGLDVTQPIAKSYPRAVVTQAIDLTARTLWPELPIDDAWYQVGKHVVRGLERQSLMGATVLAIRVAGPRFTLKVAARTFRQTNNFMRVELNERAPGRYELDLSPSHAHTRYMEAVIEDMLAIAGAKNLHVTVLSHDPKTEHVRYGISFT